VARFIVLLDDRDLHGLHGHPRRRCGASQVRIKALIVDDHALIWRALQIVLKRLKRNAAVFEAPSSREAMQIIERHPDFSLVLLDINLPDRNGFSVLGEGSLPNRCDPHFLDLE
jgi:PleD family two-component response regulator